MPEFGCTPDEVSYNIILKGLCDEKRIEEALQLLFHKMDDRGISPTVVTYNTVIDGLCKVQAVDRAEGVLQQMIHKGVKPNIQTYNL